MSKLVRIDTIAPTPLMVETAATAFGKLRKAVFDGSGVDFLMRCGDVSRPAGFRSTKDGVVNRSWHKTGRAFDYDQTSKAIVVVSEPGKDGKQYFRTYIRCADQSGKQGKRERVRDYRGFTVDAFLFDFTAAAERLQFRRIPAWHGWQRRYNRREFWHYQFNPEGLSWDAAMRDLAVGRGEVKPMKQPKVPAVLGPNDRGPEVRKIQVALNAAGLLPQTEIDGIYGRHTKNAVAEFQRQKRLDIDGLVGPLTRKELGL